MIEQTIEFDAPVDMVFGMLADHRKFADFTGLPASFEAREGASLSLFDGMITGRMVEIVDGQRIVQAWRAGNWDDGDYSIAKFAFAAAGNGTAITLRHDGYPPGTGDHLAQGWHERYWQPMAAYLKRQGR